MLGLHLSHRKLTLPIPIINGISMNTLFTSTLFLILMLPVSSFANSLNTVEFIFGGATQTKGSTLFDNGDLDADIDVSFGVRGMFEVYKKIGAEFSYQDFGGVENHEQLVQVLR